jgi:hypothetical protein
MSRLLRTALLACVLLGLPAAIRAQSPEPVRPVAEATRRSGEIDLDGRLDEASWQAARIVSDFTQVDPEEGRAVSQPTEARILFDDEALYIGVRLTDDGGVTGRLGRRDMALGDSDWFGVVIDSYHDHRTGFVFDVNPVGVQRDAVKSISGTGGERDDNSWDAVWDVATSVDEGGWTVEYRIPFSQLRFNDTEAPIWGIQLERVIGRRREYAVSSFTPKSEAGGIPTYGHLEGLEGIRAGNRLELLPYVLSRGEFVDPGLNPFRSDHEASGEVGADLRFRVTSDLTLNASINPDFGQVEVDPAVVNLGVYEVFFQERRPFFVEGSEIFDFGQNTSGGRLFYSRRIGRAPQLGAPTSAADVPDVSRIWGAAKFSGKTESGWSIGVVEALTGREAARVQIDGAESSVAVEPLTNYLVARVRKDGNEGRASLGGMITAVSRDLDTGPLEAALRSSGYAGGLDGRIESADRAWALLGSAAFSRVSGSAEALVRTQQAGNHFFQRPDADHLEVDPDAGALTGYSIGASAERQGGEHWRGSLAIAATSPAFEVNDLGFQTRTDRRDAALALSYRQDQPGSFFRDYSITSNVRAEHNFDWQRVQGVWSGGFNFRGLAFWGGHLGVTRSFRANDDRSTRGGPLMERPANWNGFAAIYSDQRKSVTLSTTLRGSRDDYEGWSGSAQIGLGFRPSDRWNLSLSPSWSVNRTDAQYVGTVADEAAVATYGARYLFAPLKQTTLAMETRLNVTFTPRLSFELFAQPFMSSGDYGVVGELAEPGTYLFQPTPVDPPDRDFNLRSLRGTAVLRWEWRAGSTLYLAWQQNRRSFGPDGDFDFSRDRGALFDAPPDNIFLLKVSYWFTR